MDTWRAETLCVVVVLLNMCVCVCARARAKGRCYCDNAGGYVTVHSAVAVHLPSCLCFTNVTQPSLTLTCAVLTSLNRQ